MTAYRYDTGMLRADYLRAGAGLVLTAGPLLFVPAHPVVFWLLLAAALLFAVFLARTVLRQMSSIELDDTGIVEHGPLGAAIRWPDLQALDLKYFSTRRDRRNGWMQLRLKGGGRSIAIESSMHGFDQIADRAAEAAFAQRLAISDTTVTNLLAIGVEVPDWADATERAASPPLPEEPRR
ncbi:MAG: hypothetical protein RLO50_04535 [Azospirillaceae bacterium]